MNRHDIRSLVAQVLTRRARKQYQKFRDMARGSKERREVHDFFIGIALAAVKAAREAGSAPKLTTRSAAVGEHWHLDEVAS